MTDATTDQDTTERVAAGTVQQVDLTTLTLDTNIRTDARLDDEFLDSIRTFGILDPIQVRVDAVGQLLIVDGQRRYLAALQLGHATAPVVVVHGIDGDEDRIRQQWHLNEHRAGLTRTERAAVVDQMSLFGRTPADIARALAAPRAEVDAALTVAKSEPVKELVAARPELDLVTAAKLAEFADDPETLAMLADDARDNAESLDHLIEEERQNRAIQQAVDARCDEFTAEGVAVIDVPTGSTLQYLTDTQREPDGPIVAALTPEEHADCPHRAVYVYGRWIDGAPNVTVTEYCADPAAAGHHNRFATNTRPTDPEEASAERRHVIAQNKASDAARAVRERFILEQLTAAAMPKDAVQHIDIIVQVGASSFTDYGTNNLWDQWVKASDLKGGPKSVRTSTRNLLLRALATGEHCLQRDFWRIPARENYLTGGPEVRVLHLQYLAKHGYQLATVEQEWLDAATGETA